MENKKNKIHVSTLVIFWITFAFFILVVLNIFVMNEIDQFNTDFHSRLTVTG